MDHKILKETVYDNIFANKTWVLNNLRLLEFEFTKCSQIRIQGYLFSIEINLTNENKSY